MLVMAALLLANARALRSRSHAVPRWSVRQVLSSSSDGERGDASDAVLGGTPRARNCTHFDASQNI